MTRSPLISDEQMSQIRHKAGLPQFAPALELLRHEVVTFLPAP